MLVREKEVCVFVCMYLLECVCFCVFVCEREGVCVLECVLLCVCVRERGMPRLYMVAIFVSVCGTVRNGGRVAGGCGVCLHVCVYV